MRNDIYTLPQITFVAGQSQTLRWRLLTQSKAPFNASDCTGNFAVVDYSDKNGDPLISKPLLFVIDDSISEIKNIATVELLSSDTLGFSGKYIYQITIKDMNGKSEIPNQGILLISHNINESFLQL